jgi:uroporphyrin-III C-methyltransferase/precorrin-2 dehydrogenase/sirohydrochlorin ferrochelatase
MKYFPIFVDLEDRRVLVVGGGEAAAQKVRLLLKTAARISVVGEDICEELADLARFGRLEILQREFQPSDLEEAALVFLASGDVELDSRIASLAGAWDIPVNVVDKPDLCSFITPAIVDRDPLVVAIGTEGTAPVLAQGIKARLESILPHRLGALAKRAGRLRPRVAKTLRQGAHRRAFWRNFFFGPVRDAFLAGDTRAFDRRVDRALDSTREQDQVGSVVLVGAGPGDPELLTLKAQRLLQDADVIVYDRLVGERVLEYARRDAERIAVGKTPGRPSPAQGDINRTLIAQALKGKLVVRLKGGDPYVFGRGGEEQSALEAVGIPVEVVPGITAAAACAASIKLPLTTRGQNRSFSVLTGMTETGAAEHDWNALAQPGAAFAVYMGVGTANHTEARLLGAGIDPETPVVIVENGTLPSERAVATRIGELTATIASEQIAGPAIIFVGLEPAAETKVQPAPARVTQTVVPFRRAAEPRLVEAS